MDIHPQGALTLVLWDTFEWGLWFGGHTLSSCGNTYSLCTRNDGWPGTVLCREEAEGPRRFWSDFTTAEMRARLEGMLGLRALAAVAEGTFRIRMSELRNDAGKIVCRVEWTSVAAGKQGGKRQAHSCRVLPLGGYADEASRVTDFLVQRGAKPEDTGPLETLLRIANRDPRRYTLRPDFGLERGTTARDAVGLIVRRILMIAVSNVPGILHDLDTEFLHDYRICLRKIRSLLGLMKDVYPVEEARRMRKILGDLARRTNRLRDLDVYLLARDNYLGFVPPELRPALDGMFGDFSVEREDEARQVISHLRSASTRRLLREMEVFFSEEASHEPSPAAELPVGPLVYNRIWKRYRTIRSSAAEAVGADSVDEMVHRLRIECKKLRYLLEFFSEIMPRKGGAEILSSLRRLQNRLGEFNDASVQQKTLLSYWEMKKPGADVTLGLGGLISVLYYRQQETRALIEQELHEFCGDATAAVFKRLFKPSSDAGVTGGAGSTEP